MKILGWLGYSVLCILMVVFGGLLLASIAELCYYLFRYFVN